MIHQWESLAALIRDIGTLQDQHQYLNEKLWRSCHTVQQLTVQVAQFKTSLAQSNHTLRQAQGDLQQQRQYLQQEQKEHNQARDSLAHEISIHTQTEKSLTSEREMNMILINLCNQFDLTKAHPVSVPEGMKLGSFLEENRELKKASKEYKARIERDKYIIESSEASIEMLKREEQHVLDALDEKEMELSKANGSLVPAEEQLPSP